MKDTDRGPRDARAALLGRLVLYGLFAGLAFEGVVRASANYPVSVFAKEGGPLEILQHVLGISAACLFFAAAACNEARRSLLVLAGLCALLAVAREADHFFDQAIGRGGYTYFTWPLGIAAIAVALRARNRIVDEVLSFAATPAFFFAVLAAFVILVYGQIVGQKQLWQAVMGDGYQRGVKDSVEEIQELLGYALLLFASIEALIWERRSATQPGNDDS
jgi:hypothetical protein